MLSRDPAHRILIIDADPTSVAPLRAGLLQRSFHVEISADGAAALRGIASRPPNLLILDWDMPGFAALEIIRAVREPNYGRAIRVMIISRLAEEHDIVCGFEQGADDYIAKPFSILEVMARIGALLRERRTENETMAVTCGPLKLDCVTHEVTAGGRPINLAGAEYRLLKFLMIHSGRTFTRNQLSSEVWDEQEPVDPRTVDVNVRRLRRVLAGPGCANYVQTVRGFGYRFVNSSWVLQP